MDETIGKPLSGAKAQIILLALSARLKSCPDTRPIRCHSEEGFSATFKTPFHFQSFSARLTPNPIDEDLSLETPEESR
ncbi:MAG: hypothetical protein ABR956_10475, partial [Terracidiphilus sp.]